MWLIDKILGRLNYEYTVEKMRKRGAKIGDNVVIGAGSVVTKSIPSNSIAIGNPSSVFNLSLKKINRRDRSSATRIG